MEGDEIVVAGVGLALSVLDIPGHTAGHIAYVSRSGTAPLVFCGDTLFAVGCGRLFEGTPTDMVASLDKLAALPASTLVYCGHEYTLANLRFALAVEPGNAALREREITVRTQRARGEPTLPTTIGDELATNPFLRTGKRRSGPRHRRTRIASSPIGSACSPKSAPGRMRFASYPRELSATFEGASA